VTRTQTDSNRKCAADDAQYAQKCRRDDGRVAEVKLFHPARFAADKDDIHSDDASNADVMLKIRRLILMKEIMPRGGALRLSSKLTQNKDFRTVYAVG